MRTIKCHISQAQLELPGVPKVLHYFTWWAYSRYDTVELWPDRGTEADFIAVFSNEGDEGENRYVIGAVHRGQGEYSYHS